MQALVEASDRDIYDDIVQGDGHKTFLTERVEAMLVKARRFSLFTRQQTLAFLGSRFAAVLSAPESTPDAQLGELLLKRVLFVHLTDNRDKYRLLMYVVGHRTALRAVRIPRANQISTGGPYVTARFPATWCKSSMRWPLANACPTTPTQR